MSLLEVAGVSVRFGGVQALDSVDLTVETGVVTGLIGPNGAGKTTTFNVVTGLQPPTSGRVRLDGEDITGLKPHLRARLGLARTFQRLEVFGSLSARDNLKVGAEIKGKAGADGRSPDAVADEVLARVGLTHVADERVDAMPTGMARLVELGRALATHPRVLLLDEPSSGLNEEETEDLGRLLLELADEGLGILLVEHDVELVMRVCSTIHVLDFGRILAVGAPADIQADPQVQAAYLGLEGADAHPTATTTKKKTPAAARGKESVTATVDNQPVEDEDPPPATPSTSSTTGKLTKAEKRARWGRNGRRPVLLLSAVGFIDAVDRGILPGVIERIKDARGFSDTQLGFLATALVITSMAMTIPSGYIADRYTRTKVIAIVLGSWGIISGLTGACRAYWQFIAVRGALGIADTIDNPASASLVADYYPPAVRGRAYAVSRVAPTLGTPVGLVLAGIVGEALGWQWAFVIVGVPGSLLAFAIWRMREPARGESDRMAELAEPEPVADVAPPRAAARRSRKVAADAPAPVSTSTIGPVPEELAVDPGSGFAAMMTDLRRVARIRTLRALMVGGAVGAAATSGLAFWAPAYYERSQGLSGGRAAGIVGGVILLGAIAGTLLGGILIDRLRGRVEGAPMLAAGLGQLIGGTLLWVSFFGFPLALQLPIQLVGVMGLVGAIPALATMTSEIVPASVRGAAFSLTAVLGSLMGAFSPPLLGFVADQFPVIVEGKSVGNLALGFRVVTPLVMLGGAVLLQGRRWVTKDLANVANA